MLSHLTFWFDSIKLWCVCPSSLFTVVYKLSINQWGGLNNRTKTACKEGYGLTLKDPSVSSSFYLVVVFSHKLDKYYNQFFLNDLFVTPESSNKHIRFREVLNDLLSVTRNWFSSVGPCSTDDVGWQSSVDSQFKLVWTWTGPEIKRKQETIYFLDLDQINFRSLSFSMICLHGFSTSCRGEWFIVAL